MDKIEAAVRPEKLKIIHPTNLGPVGIDNLFIQQGFL